MCREIGSQHPRDLAEWLDFLEHQRPSSLYKLGLERLAPLVDILSLKKPASLIITVVGTNGKGSTVAILESLLLAQGYTVGAYTSPHLQDFNERVRIGGRPVQNQVLVNAFNELAEHRTASLTYFEWITLAALYIFEQNTLDVVILEAGMGGRLDAVNVVDADYCLVSSIGLDHCEWLGNTREAIAYEKAGVFRYKQQIFCGDPSPPQTMVEYARQIGACWHVLGYDYDFTTDSATIDMCFGHQRYRLSKPPSFHPHNLVNAIACFLSLPFVRDIPGNGCGLQQIRLAGRCERIPGSPAVWLDVCHNMESLNYLLTVLQSEPGKKVAVFGALEDKPIADMMALASDVFEAWYLAPLGCRRSINAHTLAAVAKQNLSKPWQMCESLAEAFEQSMLTNGDCVVVFGSFYTVAAYYDWCDSHVGAEMI